MKYIKAITISLYLRRNHFISMKKNAQERFYLETGGSGFIGFDTKIIIIQHFLIQGIISHTFGIDLCQMT